MKGHSASTPSPEALLELYAEDYGAGNPATFIPTVGGQLTKSGTPTFQSRPVELGKGVIDLDNTTAFFTFDSAITTEKRNYAIFTVVRQLGSTSSAQILDFRDGGNSKMIIPAYSTGTTTNGWFYGQTGSLNTLGVIAGEDTANFTIRCYLFEDTVGRLFLGGGTVDKTGAMEATALNTKRQLGTIGSSSIDVECAHVSIYSLPIGRTFKASFLDVKGEALETYYSGGSSAEPVWSAITV
jgi:hypothetical protein